MRHPCFLIALMGVLVVFQSSLSAAQSQQDLFSNVAQDAQAFDTENSLLFSFWERTALLDARNSRGLVRPPTEAELTRDLKKGNSQAELVKPPPEKRNITLGGIIYRTSSDWTIWLNGKRVTPTALPEEILDLRVFNAYIEVKWFDQYTNQILPIRLRPHQRFNIDTRIFLPG